MRKYDLRKAGVTARRLHTEGIEIRHDEVTLVMQDVNGYAFSVSDEGGEVLFTLPLSGSGEGTISRQLVMAGLADNRSVSLLAFALDVLRVPLVRGDPFVCIQI